MEQWFEKIGKKANICCEYAPVINAPFLVEQGIGIAILPASVRNVLNGQAMVLKRLVNPEEFSHVAVLVDKYHALPRTAQMFLEEIRRGGGRPGQTPDFLHLNGWTEDERGHVTD